MTVYEKIFLLVITILELAEMQDAYNTYGDKRWSVYSNITDIGNDTYMIDMIRPVVKRITPIMFRRSVDNDPDTLVCSNSFEDFPKVIDMDLIRHGAVVVCFLVAIYCFTTIAIICDKYFLPCVQCICQRLNISQDVAAATFMSVATSSPEFFVNVVGTFITHSDIGVGTIVGSSMFNTLGVASIGGLAASKPIQLDWWPLTRDIIMYMCSVAILVSITWDGVIEWYEALVLFIMYFLYFTIMFQSPRIVQLAQKCFQRKPTKQIASANGTIPKLSPDVLSSLSADVDNKVLVLSRNYMESPSYIPDSNIENIENGHINNNIQVISKHYKDKSSFSSNSKYENSGNGHVITDIDKKEKKSVEERSDTFKMPEGNCTQRLFFIYSWPIRFILFCTIPDCEKHKRWYPVTFIMCVIWIGLSAYLISWMITVIGYTLGIPDSVLGLTFLAAGGCLPEAISITIMSRKGEGAMGISNALGGNTMNILFSLGMPWFIKTTIVGKAGPDSHIVIESGSIEYTIMALIVIAIVLYAVLAINKFQLSRRFGFTLFGIYLIFLTFAIVTELLWFKQTDCKNI